MLCPLRKQKACLQPSPPLLTSQWMFSNLIYRVLSATDHLCSNHVVTHVKEESKHHFLFFYYILGRKLTTWVTT